MAARTITPSVEAVGGAKALLGESVFYEPTADALHWVDIPGQALLSTDASTGRTERTAFPQQCGFVQPCDDGALLVGQADSILHFDASRKTTEPLATIEANDPTTRTNDAVCDPQGQLIVGTMRPAPQGTTPDPVGVLHRVDATGRKTTLLSGLSIPNGLAFSPDGRTLYLADTPGRIVWRMDFDADTGSLGERCVFCRLTEAEGRPDGAAIDADGCYWVAAVWGWQLLRYTPQGTLDLVVRLPVQRPTKLAFGGRDHRTIYVTSASTHLTDPERQTLAGRLIAFDVGIAGLPANPFHAKWEGKDQKRGTDSQK